MTNRAYNFNAGPAALPLEVLQQAQEEFIDYRVQACPSWKCRTEARMYEQVNNETQALLRELYGIPSNYKVLVPARRSKHAICDDSDESVATWSTALM